MISTKELMSRFLFWRQVVEAGLSDPGFLMIWPRVSQPGPFVPPLGATSRSPYEICRDIAKPYWWAGSHKCWESFEGVI